MPHDGSIEPEERRYGNVARKHRRDAESPAILSDSTRPVEENLSRR
jgi:hypothetical protein